MYLPTLTLVRLRGVFTIYCTVFADLYCTFITQPICVILRRLVLLRLLMCLDFVLTYATAEQIDWFHLLALKLALQLLLRRMRIRVYVYLHTYTSCALFDLRARELTLTLVLYF